MSEGFSARRVEVRRGLLAKMTAKENELNAEATRGNLTRGKVPTAGCRAFLQTANFGPLGLGHMVLVGRLVPFAEPASLP